MLSSNTESGVAPPRVAQVPLDQLHPDASNPRTHKPKQIRQIADSIAKFGFTNPILIDEAGSVLAGHGRLAAAQLLGLKFVPTICLAHMSRAEKRAYIIADNKLSDSSSFDRKMLTEEVALILSLDPSFDLGVTGFEIKEIELLLDQGDARPRPEPATPPPARAFPPVCREGDLWTLGSHKLLCGDALLKQSYVRLMGRNRAQVVFVDPPYNQKPSDISGKGRIMHGAFAFASGEMSEAEFIRFLITAMTHLAKASANGSVHYICMDWRHQFELLTAARAVYDRQLDLCVWAKGQPAMGAPYRSQHELVGVFKHGTRSHIDNVQLGKHGRNRSNLWSYSSGSSFSRGRQQELAWHATVKPIALVEDALLDTSARDDIVLDAFAGSGTTLIAAQRCGRQARVMEIDPYYCDVIIRRYEAETGIAAVEAGGDTFTHREANPAVSLAERSDSHE